MGFSFQRGFALVSGIFLLVVLTALGAFLVVFSATENASSTQDVQGTRAYQAARAGVEWAAFNIVQNAGAGYELNCRNVGGTSQALAGMGGTLSSFGVTVGCTATSYTEGASTVWIYRITSTAILTGTAAQQKNYVERQLQVTIER